ncbi:Uncharacterized protein dnm_035620 [Desulfonema magnum]|uniref:Uncharacterized protein n=1 Tax=Desulfonema magnum TaxID=45655 RepID=A0A975BLS7_9BACT|nr:Uncharacterized protein dnm_035620 [Desulfonema magnum]
MTKLFHIPLKTRKNRHLLISYLIVWHFQVLILKHFLSFLKLSGQPKKYHTE